MRILIISYYFPPYNTMGAIRVGKIARYLLNHGHDVRVITAKSQSLGGPISTTLHVEIPRENIEYCSWINHRKIASLLKFHKRNQEKPLGGTGYIGWLPCATLAAVRTIKRWRPDIIYASAMPSVALIAAYLSSRITSRPWVAELRDLWSDNYYTNYSPKRKQLETWIERKVLSSALGHVTVSEPLAQILEQKFRKPISIIMNGFDPEDYPRPFFQPQASNGPLKISYTGSIYSGKQDLSPLFKAIKMMSLQPKDISIEFYGTNPDLVYRAATEHKVLNLVKIFPAIPHREALSIQCNSDLLLLLLWTDSQEKGVFTGKIFEYIGSRRPILAIGPSDSVAADLIEKRRVGIVLSDWKEIAQHLEFRIEQKRKGGITSLPEDVTMELTREEQVEKLEIFLTRLLS